MKERSAEWWLGQIHAVAHSQLGELKEMNHKLSEHHGKNTTITVINIFIGGQMPLDLSKLNAALTADTTVGDVIDTYTDLVVQAFKDAGAGTDAQKEIDAIANKLMSNVERQRIKASALKNLVTPGGGFALSPLIETATAGVAYSGQLVASGGTPPYSNYALTAGSLPNGLQLDPTTGAITGTPDTAEARGFDASASDAGGIAANSTGNLITVN